MEKLENRRTQSFTGFPYSCEIYQKPHQAVMANSQERLLCDSGRRRNITLVAGTLKQNKTNKQSRTIPPPLKKNLYIKIYT
jgi:hypothetical protein